jgi:sterol desaturase/sphingolipid hydroxylase (fatty acid hydroxylase superfamily)
VEYLKTIAFAAFLNLLAYLLIPCSTYLIVTRLSKKHWKDKRIQPIALKRSDLFRDFAYSLGAAPVYGVVFAPIYYKPQGVGFWSNLLQSNRLYENPDLYGYSWLVISFLLLLVVEDTYFYWVHRLTHHPALFWLVHRWHHLSTNPSPLAAHAFDPLDTFLQLIWVLPLIFVMPIHRGVLALFSILNLMSSVIGHLSIELYPRRWAQHPVLKWINTATYHNDHHQHYRCNYGNYFMFWDRLMKTEHPRRDSKDLAQP